MGSPRGHSGHSRPYGLRALCHKCPGALINYHRRGGLNNSHLFSPSPGGQKCKVKVSVGLVPSGDSEGTTIPVSPRDPWPSLGDRCITLASASQPLPVYLFSLCYKDPTLVTSPELDHTCKDPISKQVTCLGTGVLGLSVSLGRHSSTHDNYPRRVKTLKRWTMFRPDTHAGETSGRGFVGDHRMLQPSRPAPGAGERGPWVWRAPGP